jgi:hypothetical protein
MCVYVRRGVSALACSHLSYITMLSFGARQAVYAPRADLIYGFCRVCVLYRCPISIHTCACVFKARLAQLLRLRVQLLIGVKNAECTRSE